MTYYEPCVGGGAVLLSILEPGTEPFLRWAGGKRQLVNAVKERLVLPPKSKLVAADSNPDLIAAWVAVRDDLEGLLRALRVPLRTKEAFYAIRDRQPTDPVERGARAIYLNLYAFNGLWRTNLAGHFNAPCDEARFARVRQIVIEGRLRKVSELIRDVQVECVDIVELLERCGAGDAAYVDTPYLPEPETKTAFVGYSAGRDWRDPKEHEAVIEAGALAVLRGARLVFSNSVAARPLYERILEDLPNLQIDVVTTRRNISSKADFRGQVPELLVSVGQTPSAE